MNKDTILFDGKSIEVYMLDYRRSLDGEEGEIYLQTPLVFPNGDQLEIIAPDFRLHITAVVDFHQVSSGSNWGYLSLRNIKDMAK